MLTRLMPGVALAALLALSAGFLDAAPAPPAQPRQPTLSERLLRRRPQSTMTPAPTEAPAPSKTPVLREFFTAFAPAPVPAPAEPAAPPARRKRAARTTPPRAPARTAPACTADSAAPARRGAATAYASLAFPDAFRDSELGDPRRPVASPAVDTTPSGSPPPLDILVRPAHSLPPARGLRAWVSTETSRAEQALSDEDTAAYTLAETKHSAGLDYDWSVDTTLGVSADILDATVKSLQPHDRRRSDVTGLVANARVDTVLFNTFLLGLGGFYGSLDTEGAGDLGAWNTGGATTSFFRENGHESAVYGLSGRLSVPMLAGGWRTVVGAGAEYSRIDADAFEYTLASAGTASMEKTSSSSLRFPVDFSVERDFVKSWGLLTPRLTGGYVYETSDTANGVRALGALSASRVPFESYGGLDFVRSPVPFFSLRRTMYSLGAGIDIRTLGGWRFSADYRRDIAAAYTRDAFRFELGRSF